MSLGLIDIVEFRLISDGLQTGLQGQHAVIARHHGDCLEFQPFRQMHRANQDVFIGKLIPWRDVLKLRREQLRAAAAQATQPALFELHEDRRPTHEATAAGRYREPTLFERLTRG